MTDVNGDKLYVGCVVKLLEKPCGYVTKDYKLTVDNNYIVIGFEGSNVITTTDEPDINCSYNRQRVERLKESKLRDVPINQPFLIIDASFINVPFKFFIKECPFGNFGGKTYALVSPVDKPVECQWRDLDSIVEIYYPV